MVPLASKLSGEGSLFKTKAYDGQFPGRVLFEWCCYDLSLFPGGLCLCFGLLSIPTLLCWCGYNNLYKNILPKCFKHGIYLSSGHIAVHVMLVQDVWLGDTLQLWAAWQCFI